MAKMKKQPICDVCKKLGVHKHRYEYCEICRKKTVHVVPLFGFPWVCQNKHPNDETKCRRCGQKCKELNTIIITEKGSGGFCNKCSKLIEKEVFGQPLRPSKR